MCIKGSEYTHLIVDQSHLHLPIWLNEGLADLYASIQLDGSRAVVGGPVNQHLAALASQKWLGISFLINVSHQSSDYNAPGKVTMFYAESWALAHMLVAQQPYRSRFSDFVAFIALGHTTEEAFRAIYNKIPAEVASALTRHVVTGEIQSPIFETRLPALSFSAHVESLSPLQTDLALADLLASHESSAAQAREWLNQIARESFSVG